MANSNEHDYDDLLAQATAPRTTSSIKRAPKTEKSIIFDRDDEDRVKFKIDQKDKSLAGGLPSMRNGARLELDPESFTNEVEVAEASRKRKKLFLILGSFFVAMVFVWGITSAFPSNSVQQNLPLSNPTDPNETQKFLELYPNAPMANVPQITLTVDGNTVKTVVGESNKFSLTFNDGIQFPVLSECKLSKVGEFTRCLTSDPAAPGDGSSLWLTKDAVHSNLFAKATKFEEVEVTGAATAAVMSLTGLAPQARPTLVIVAPDVTGYIITLSADATIADAKELAKTITVE